MFDIDSPFSMVVLIVLISVGAGVINNWIKMRNTGRATVETDAEIHRLREDVARLKERVRVLEKIATDEDRTLRDEISRLA
ncbi:MAG: hypothetical protein AAFQ67_05240 [Pseudomonadota bacterium]